MSKYQSMLDAYVADLIKVGVFYILYMFYIILFETSFFYFLYSVIVRLYNIRLVDTRG